MKISEKIAQIRVQPEHVRLRYVWGSVAISMFFIFAIWIFSMGSLFQGNKNNNQEGDAQPSITEQLQTLKQHAPSIKNLTEQTIGAASEGVDTNKQSSDFQYPLPNTQESAPQADAYSELPAETPAQ